MKSCPFTREECLQDKCAGWGSLPSFEGKTCIPVAGFTSMVVQANKTLRENRMPIPVDAYDDDDDDELPSSRPRRF